ncbi:MAG TPA: DnaJ C-terminal domain-containing protein [Candidatus Dormibacteraeota bacterium]
MEFRDYYATLGVPRTATDKEIRARYRKLARELHPDVNKDPKATERFKRVNEAYEVLKDQEKRSKYDRLGADWEQIERAEAFRREHGQPFAEAGARARDTAQRAADRSGARFGGFSDFFETFFGTRGTGGDGADPWIEAQMEQLRRENSASKKGADTEDQLEVTLAEAVQGGERTMHVSIVEPCPTCRGSGRVAEGGSSGGTATQVGVKACPACSGTGRQYRRRTLKVTIPPGVTEGSKIRVAGEGGSGVREGGRGDLYLRVRLKLDRGTEVKGRNVYRDLPVRDYRAALGGKVVAEGPTGRLEVTIPPHCPPGRTLRVVGKGIPQLKASATPGDLFLRVKVLSAGRSPLSEEERAAYLQLAAADGSID